MLGQAIVGGNVPRLGQNRGGFGAMNLGNSENDRVNNMNQQEFDDYMNELHMRDNQKPINENVLSQLPRSRFNGNPVQQAANGGPAASDESNCSICMSDYEREEEILTLTCFHKFHAQCVEEWFKSQNWCPVCRTKIDA